MTRAAAFLAVVAVAAVVALVALGGGGAKGSDADYWVELDNAFGLIEGGDLKVAGVRAGKVTDLELDKRSLRARVGIKLDRDGFGSLRRDVHCSSRPQSLIGEYFVDCLPGRSSAVLARGSVIPVTQTDSTVGPDLVNTILRRPFRERLTLLVGELGAAAAANGENLNAALRRGVPAIRETDKVLRTLGDQNQVLGDLVRDAERVVGELADNRKDVGRFVVNARRTSEVSASRKREIAEGLRELPGFLEQLSPTMRQLGRVADGQRPALTDLRAASGDLKTFFGRLEPFAKASTPAIRALGEASEPGRDAVKAAGPVVRELARSQRGTPELAKNLAIILEHLDDRDFAVDPGDPNFGGKGQTGLEALLSYTRDQTLSTNVYDSAQHYLKISLLLGDCANYRDAAAVKADPELEKKCGGRLGPNAPGINYPDVTAGGETATRRRQDRRAPDRQEPKAGGPEVPAFAPAPATGSQPAPTTTPTPQPPVRTITVPKILEGQPELPPVTVPDPKQLLPFLDYLLGR